MSKGHGHVERAILEALKWHRLMDRQGLHAIGARVEDIAHYVYCGPHVRCSVDCPRFYNGGYASTRSQLEAVRRALRNLRKQGLVTPPQRFGLVIYTAPNAKPPKSG
jgi:hypothetical protein